MQLGGPGPSNLALISNQDWKSAPCGQVVVLTDEERRTLIAEGYPIPQRFPLSKAEERSLKKIRRKIKNKISAQESRRKKKEYMEELEKKVHAMELKIMELERENRLFRERLQPQQSPLDSGKAFKETCQADAALGSDKTGAHDNNDASSVDMSQPCQSASQAQVLPTTIQLQQQADRSSDGVKIKIELEPARVLMLERQHQAHLQHKNQQQQHLSACKESPAIGLSQVKGDQQQVELAAPTSGQQVHESENANAPLGSAESDQPQQAVSSPHSTDDDYFIDDILMSQERQEQRKFARRAAAAGGDSSSSLDEDEDDDLVANLVSVVCETDDMNLVRSICDEQDQRHQQQHVMLDAASGRCDPNQHSGIKTEDLTERRDTFKLVAST